MIVKLTIDNIPVEVADGTSVMEAAALLGKTIPSMCFHPGFSNHPSCMICLVKDLDRDHLVPSCAMPVAEGMNILTDSPEVMEARREALELLLSDHVGDCEAPCRVSCPAFMDIPLMNRLIASGDFDQALHIVRQEIALPHILGYICPAPCEKACKRKPMDGAVSICLLKRSAAQFGSESEQGSQRVNTQLEASPLSTEKGKKVAIIGTGPAGLAAAFYLLRSGHGVVLFDLHKMAGGALRYQVPGDLLPHDILDSEIDHIRKMGAEFRLGIPVTRELFHETILREFHAVILTTGNLSSNPLDIFGIQPDEHGSFVDKKNFTTSIPGIFACGNVIREQKMAVQSVAHGKMVAHHVDVYLGTGVAKKEPTHKSISTIGHLFEPEWKEYLQESIPDHRIEPEGGFLKGLTREEAVIEAKRCLHCDCRKPSSCKLRHYAEEYDVHRRRYAGPERNMLTRSLQHDLVVYETEKCIRCGLCVEITQRHGESIGLTFIGRGFDVRISVPFNETTLEALTKAAADCVEACPTGALAYRNKEERNL